MAFSQILVEDQLSIISNATTAAQLESSLVTLGQDPSLKTDSLTLANYVTSLCGATTTTTVSGGL